MKKLIGIIGKKQSGKDTIADYLVQNKGFIKYSYAFPLKNGAMEIFGFTKEQVYGDLKEVVDPEWGVTPRKVLQIMGTELFQYDLQRHIPEFANIGRTIWVKRFSQWYKNNNDKDVVIADVWIIDPFSTLPIASLTVKFIIGAGVYLLLSAGMKMDGYLEIIGALSKFSYEGKPHE